MPLEIFAPLCMTGQIFLFRYYYHNYSLILFLFSLLDDPTLGLSTTTIHKAVHVQGMPINTDCFVQLLRKGLNKTILVEDYEAPCLMIKNIKSVPIKHR